MNIIKQIFKLKEGLNLEDVFAFDCPVFDNRFFYPRKSLYNLFCGNLRRHGTQIIVYGKRKIGKTTLILMALKNLGMKFIRVHCHPGMTSLDFMGEVLEEIDELQFERRRELETVENSVGGSSNLGVIKANAETTNTYEREIIHSNWIKYPTISKLAKTLGSAKTILFADDVEKVMKTELFSDLKILSKKLSDNSGVDNPAKIVISIATTDKDLVEESFNTKSNRLTSIRLPILSETEAEEFIRFGMDLTFLRLSDPVVNFIIQRSKGMPGEIKCWCLQTGIAMMSFLGLESKRLPEKSPEISMNWFQEYVLRKFHDMSQ